jgi:protein O-GlcNAc transferase
MFKVTLPPSVAEYISNLYSSASIVLEYGTGGSTFLALQANQKSIVYGCDTDSKWLTRLTTEVAISGYGNRFIPVHQDIGTTKEWGYPILNDGETILNRVHQMVNAPIQPWRILANTKSSPDVILIDGRFRAASFLTSLANISKPCIILLDDYVKRPKYHIVERLIKPARLIDRAAIFEVEPGVHLPSISNFIELYLPLYLDPQ